MTLSLCSDLIIFPTGARAVEYTTGDELRTSGADVEFDHDNDDIDEPAKLNLVFTR